MPPFREPLDADDLRRAALPPAGPWRRLDVVEQTGSTNADLLARAAAGEDIAGAVLIAEYQSAGRGRHGRQWLAPPRSLLALSVGVPTTGVDPDRWGWLPLATGVAVVDALAEVTGVAAGLKWPNDVQVDGRKVAGILAEVAAPAPVVVVGLGLNVSLTDAELPDPAATSLTLLGASVTDRNVLLTAVLRRLAERFAAWRTGPGASPALADDYRRHSRTLGTRVRASLPGGQSLIGTATGIDAAGRLQIDTGAGTAVVSAGDITHLRPDAGAAAG
ncbi:biotin--[acetyl-CoA-carboxylase] ligase [Mycolicibacterium thermoresistibile]